MNKPLNKIQANIGMRFNIEVQDALSQDAGTKKQHDIEKKGTDYQYTIKLNQNNVLLRQVLKE